MMSVESVKTITAAEVPPGFALLTTYQNHADVIKDISWSADGQFLASASADKSVRLWHRDEVEPMQTLPDHADYVFSISWSPNGHRLAAGVNHPVALLWDVERGQVMQLLEGHGGPVFSVAWSPNGRFLASASFDQTISLWYPPTQRPLRVLVGHTDWVMNVAWSPNGRFLASASRDRKIIIWRTQSGKPEHVLKGHSHIVNSVAWSPDGKILASASDDQTICLWDTETGRQLNVLEGHTGIVLCVSFSGDGRLLASKSGDGTVRLWRCDTWEPVAILIEPTTSDFCCGLAFHPHEPLLATLTGDERAIRLWRLDYHTLLRFGVADDIRHYRNAKVVLVGDPGVGKSGLSLALTGKSWAQTEPTHGHRVWRFENHEITLPDGLVENRETVLWDLAGAPGYRLISQLHLNEVAVALIVMDAHNDVDQTASIQRWDAVLRQAQRRQGGAALPLHKYLVAARLDHGSVSLPRERIDALLRDMGFDAYFEVSAKDGWQIEELREAILADIDWHILPRVTSNQLLQTIKQFLADTQESGRLLCTAEDLYREFCHAYPDLEASEELWAMFDTCISRVENRGLIRRLSFGSYILLQPERLDAYAAALVQAARSEPGGLDLLREEDALAGKFAMPQRERVTAKGQERILLIATVEELLRHEIALKEVNEAGTFLLFPSQVTREREDRPDMLGHSVIFTFEGAVLSVYTTLSVRLSRSRFFNKNAMWKNAATYDALDGGGCGVYLRQLDDRRGELTLFFDEKAGDATRHQFEQYVALHLQRRAAPGSVQVRRVLTCPGCGEQVTSSQVQRRQERGFAFINCPVCDTRISLPARRELMALSEFALDSALAEMDRAADTQRDLATAEMVLRGKLAADDYDVLFIYEAIDAAAVDLLGAQLRQQGILPAIPKPENVLTEAVQINAAHYKSVAVCIGQGTPPWRNRKTVKTLRELTTGGTPLIIVLLPERQPTPDLPGHIQWVDMCQEDPDPLLLLSSFIPGGREHELPDRWRIGAAQ